MIISHRRLSPETLAGVVEEFVTRDGTEMTDAGDKSSSVTRLLERGELLLVYDTESESCNIVAADQLREIEIDDARVVKIEDSTDEP